MRVSPVPAPAPSLERARRVIRGLREAGRVALLAGGSVRDLLLSRPPEDYDVATSATPAETARIFPKTVPVGERFGVVLVLIDGAPVEVATFRRDARYEDGRRPVSVEFTTDPAEDAVRRDFTVNGLFLEPDSGEVIDYVGGRRDLADRVLRAIGDPEIRFDEDRLRMLRAARFAADLGFEIDDATFRAIVRRAGEIRSVSGERIRDELLRILTGRDPVRGLRLLKALGLLRAALPEVEAMEAVPQPPRYHPEGDVWTHTLAAVGVLRKPSPVVALATLLHDVGKPPTIRLAERVRFDDHPAVGAAMAGEIARRLRLSRAETDAIVSLVGGHLRIRDVGRMREATLRRFLAGPDAEDHFAVHEADARACGGDLSLLEFCRRRRAEILAEPPPPPRLLTGHDLIHLGLTPGPEFARILAEADDLTLEGALTTREEALAWARSRTEPEGGRA